MPSNERTLSDEIDDAIKVAELEPAEEELEGAQAPVEEGTFTAGADRIKYMMDFATPIATAREAANIPPQVTIKDLEGKTFVIMDKVKQKAFLPQDGTQHDGWQCLCADIETRKAFTVWIGQVTLKKDLELLHLPLRVTLTKRGRAYIFS